MIEPPSRQPVFNIPRTILVLIVAMAAIHGARLMLPDVSDAEVLARFAFVPGRLTALFDPAAVMDRLVAGMNEDPGPDGPAAVGQFFLGNGSAQPWTLLTYALLHGNWTHFGLNAIWLLAFGAPVARRFGPLRFALFFILSAVAGALSQYVVDPVSLQPLVGASAAVSGCMGAALRFMFQPLRRARPSLEQALRPAHQAPRVPLRAMVGDRRSAAFLIVWFVTNIVTGIAAVPLGLSDMPIAWQAHIGGFLLGLLAFPLLDPVAAAEPPKASAQLPAELGETFPEA